MLIGDNEKGGDRIEVGSWPLAKLVATALTSRRALLLSEAAAWSDCIARAITFQVFNSTRSPSLIEKLWQVIPTFQVIRRFNFGQNQITSNLTKFMYQISFMKSIAKYIFIINLC